MRALLDTCVVIDVLQGREPFCKEGQQLFLAAANDLFAGCITAKAATDIYYLTHRHTHSDKVSREVRREIIHHLIDIADPDEIYSAADFAQDADGAARRIIARGRVPLLIGGTPFYYRALSGALSEDLPKDEAVRAQLAAEIEERGLAALHDELLEIDRDIICHTINGKPVKPKTLGQKQYIDLIRTKMIVFGVGPAGTGKTYLGMSMAIQAFKNGEVNRIILTRPAIEAGEKLGFLPGDLQSKIDPYLRPLYDALYQIMGAESYLHNAEKGLIEVAPLAYMRGRTLDNAFIILDEAQNTTQAQMKMFLTRIGFGSKVIITGDQSQKDLPAGQTSGLDTALKILKDIDDIGICRFTNEDVVRHPLVQKIVKAYDEYEGRRQKS